MLAAAFVGQGIDALRSPKPAADAARPALEGLQKLPDPVGSSVPQNAETFARATAVAQILGGLLLATGKVPRLASAALATTVVPANLGTRMFWNEMDPELKAAKRRGFLTDISLVGGLIIASADTAGKPSLGWRGRRAAARFSDTVASALPAGLSAGDTDLADRVGARLQEGLTVGAERGRELAAVAAERAEPLLEAARERGAAAAERTAPLLEAARDRGTEIAHAALEQGDELATEARKRVRAWRRN
ncbi:MAG TPA: DoxX family protein [Mycobacterium sp.]|nr:DoxX family protein [Mycobacterium sp.]